MSDTPLTDAKCADFSGPLCTIGGESFIPASFAKELERENAKLREEILEWKDRAAREGYYSGHVANTFVTDSGGLSKHAKRLRELAAAGRIRIVSDFGPENDPKRKKPSKA